MTDHSPLNATTYSLAALMQGHAAPRTSSTPDLPVGTAGYLHTTPAPDDPNLDHRRTSHKAHISPTSVHDTSPHRAGLLQTRSYNASSDLTDNHAQHLRRPHSQNTIRLSSLKLSNMPMLSAQGQSSRSLGSPSRHLASASTINTHSSVLRSPFQPSQPVRPEPTLTHSGTVTKTHLTPPDEYFPPSMDFNPQTIEEQDEGGSPIQITSSSPEDSPQDSRPSGISLLRPNASRQSQSRSSSAGPSTPDRKVSTLPSLGASNVDSRQQGRVDEADNCFHPIVGSNGYKINENVAENQLRVQRDGTPLHTGIHNQSTERTPLLHISPPNSDNIGVKKAGRDNIYTVPRSYSTSSAPMFGASSEAFCGVGYGAPYSPGAGRWPTRLVRRAYNSGKRIKDNIKKTMSVNTPREIGVTALHSIPAVLLGCLLNILDGVSYGMIIFPAVGVFSGLGPMGVSMFFISAAVSQLVYCLGGSGFAGANGSMMIEVVPFFHIMANMIANQVGEGHPREIIATTLVAYAFSSILTGLAFFLLGALKLGVIVGFFPRHILVGCIGGIGVFLILTGLTVSLRIPDDAFSEAPLATIGHLFSDGKVIALWLIPLMLAFILRLITHRWRHQLVFPLYFIFVPVIFYIIVFAAKLDLVELQKAGWLFDLGSDHASWYKFYSYLDFSAVRWGPLCATLPTQFALLFFNILHPPLNVPALSVSLNEDVDTNKELVGHGYSNLLAGLTGTVPNYLVYVNTLLFYRVGGGHRIAGFLLVFANIVLLLIGTGPIAYIPVMVVGALIFVLGFDLVKEALWDTRHRANRMEYLTIISIMVCMTIWDFVIGVIFGIVVSCFFFVVQNSQRDSIRSINTGETAMSSVRRPSLQREYIREVSKQTTIIRLQGFLFFGTIAHVEDTIRSLIDAPTWKQNPIRFLVLDLALVAGVDMSSAEAFVRIQRLLYVKGITLVFCGLQVHPPEQTEIGRALASVDVLGAKGVEVCGTLNEALEWTENEYLRAWYKSYKAESTFIPRRKSSVVELYDTIGSLVRSPRHIQLREAATRTIATEPVMKPDYDPSNPPEEPFNTLRKVFQTFGEIDYDEFRPLLQPQPQSHHYLQPYLQRLSLPARHVLWRQGDPSDGLYIVESGVLKATYEYAEHTQRVEETMFPGTLAGELSALADMPRNATVSVDQHPAVVWKMSRERLRRLHVEQPELANTFVNLVLKTAKIEYDILLGALASRQ
ncbi:hypothetical protein AMATHDRAFT_76082 [Amanita thiersii Skay4041]|uniref:Cyclic nucleotide-binding domain-containing protein n=1 Tax=Amanita thiersii Skay4041 TaxID=703135 RepID=A0A2A9NPE9_9AGAR|nr:hypothetical protein AMATHDRAFT_76082 [Amanita thiersii Skay4041]